MGVGEYKNALCFMYGEEGEGYVYRCASIHSAFWGAGAGGDAIYGKRVKGNRNALACCGYGERGGRRKSRCRRKKSIELIKC